MNRSPENSASHSTGPLVDQFGRGHTNLRLSVTDRCNIRCFYCMPAENVQFRPRVELLTFEEMVQFVQAVVPLGINKLRLTGGEPLVRRGLASLISQLRTIPGLDDIALTTNGILLAEQAAGLKAAGLDRLNVSLDSLDEQVFEKITRRTGLDAVLKGIAAAQAAGFDNIRLNAIAIRGLTESEIVPLGRFAIEHGLELRFIEFMPLDADGAWEESDVLTGTEIRRTLEAEFGKLTPVHRDDPSQPAVDFQFVNGGGRVGFINPVSEPFCSSCNRLRLTAEGQIRNCLFSHEEWDARAVLRSELEPAQREPAIQDLVRSAIGAKAKAHGISEAGFQQPARAMYQIGG
ncbi:GTP 3',8-cyclase MoaA [Adhaeretor mobilis]|uniref:GTP 3',8-cyclase n=1 Tax=Adhaeretor mobilis TaxID=1930276 RepID=A0A517MUJ3_9BACT|nr:GTP 3',8-cyclase MoaA [Adhaeretor mobilis]QDS98553.1 Cyclic pyranopterin monophosphate synthase [Adhaeretor mobilis]